MDPNPRNNLFLGLGTIGTTNNGLFLGLGPIGTFFLPMDPNPRNKPFFMVTMVPNPRNKDPGPSKKKPEEARRIKKWHGTARVASPIN